MNLSKLLRSYGLNSCVSAAAAAMILAVSCSDGEQQSESRIKKDKQGAATQDASAPANEQTGEVVRTTADSEIDGFVDALDPDMFPGSGAAPAAPTPPTATPTPTPPAPNQSTATTAPDPVGTEEFTILNFDDADGIHDGAWRTKQGKGVFTYVAPKGDSGNDKLYIGAGQGRNGSNALVVEATTAAANGLPGFWVLKAGNGGLATDWSGYLLPKGKRANRIEFWLKFPAGFRQKYTSNPVLTYPNHENFILGTYNFDPAKIGTGSVVKESNNWHFYHQIYLRHDKAQDGWIKVVINESPSHQRGYSGTPGVNPTAPYGNYFEIMTRFYLDCDKYFADAEIEYPVKMLVDDIKFKYIPPAKDISVAFDNYNVGAGFSTTVGVENKVPFTVTNNEAVTEAVQIRGTNDSAIRGVKIVDASGAVIPVKQTLAPKSSKKFFLVFSAGGTVTNRDVGVAVIFEDQNKSDATSTFRSLADDNVEKRWGNNTGPTDAEVKSTFLNVTAP